MIVSYRFDVFGRTMQVEWTSDQWHVFYLGSEGKKRLAENIRIPSNVSPQDLAQYLADLCHEWATPEKPAVLVITKL